MSLGGGDRDEAQQVSQEDEHAEQDGTAHHRSLISLLPFEVLASILAQIAIESPRAFVRTLLVGREFWIPHDSALLWDPICRSVYPELASGEIHADDYEGYYNLFRQRPAVRFDGVYICISRYFRDGETYEGTISFSKPRHEVRYYRYLWLRRDGTVTSLLSNYPPKHVIGLEGASASQATGDAMHGQWSLDANTKQLKVVVDGGSRRRHDFHLLMKVASSGGKVHNKLKWVGYWCEEHGSGNVAEFNPASEGSYYFHKLPLSHQGSRAHR